MDERLEKTITKICEHIEACIDEAGSYAKGEIAEETKALAELVNAKNCTKILKGLGSSGCKHP